MTALAVDPADPGEARALIAASQALMDSLYPPESNHNLGVDALRGGDTRFFVARQNGEVLGCGALAMKDGYGEVKALFTSDAARGRGIAAAVLRRIEAEARRAGLPLLRLETGSTLRAALRLYARHGFRRRGPFGTYADDPLSVFMEKSL